MRLIANDMQTALAAPTIWPFLLAEIQFETTILYASTLSRDISWNGKTWQGNGWFQGISPVSESTELKSSSCQVLLSGIPEALIAEVLGDASQSKQGIFYLGALNASGQVISDPILLYRGTMDVPEILDGRDKATVQITYESALVRLQDKNETRFTHESQQRLFPGDKGFEFVPKLADWRGHWGIASQPAIQDSTKKSGGSRGSRSGSSSKTPVGVEILPGLYRTPGGALFYTPSYGNYYKNNSSSTRSSYSVSRQATSISSKAKNSERGLNYDESMVGRDFSFKESAASSRVVYGRTRLGGVYTYIDTNDDSRASLVTGDDTSQIVWIAKNTGQSYNDVSVTIDCSGTYSATTASVSGLDITVRLKSINAEPQDTVDTVLAVLQATPAVMALVDVGKADDDDVGIVLPCLKTYLSGGGGTWFYQYITLTCHQVESIEKLFFNEEQVEFASTNAAAPSGDKRWAIGKYYGKVFMSTSQKGKDSQSANPDMLYRLAPNWTVDHRQRGNAGVFLILIWDSKKFLEGTTPKISFQVKGRKCYDPRSEVTQWTENAALIIADYLTNTRFGMKVPWSEIDIPALIEAANICGETIELKGGLTEKRYSINGAFETSGTHQSILEQFAAAIAGDIVYSQGKWRILPGKWRAPVGTITEADIVSDIQIQTNITKRDRYNTVTGTFVNPAENYQNDDLPILRDDAGVARDGQELVFDMSLNFTTSKAAAQRLAKIILKKCQQQIIVRLSVRLSAVKYQVGDVLSLTFPRYGWSSKAFEVKEAVPTITADNGIIIDLLLRETHSSIFDWTSSEESTKDPAPDTNLPKVGKVGTITGLLLESGTEQLIPKADGTILTRLKVSWTPIKDIYVQDGGEIQLEYKKSTSSSWLAAGKVAGEIAEFYITNVFDGIAYDVRVRGQNGFGATGDWAYCYGHIVLGKTEPPSNVSGFSVSLYNAGMRLSWLPISDLDLSCYEIRQGASWETSSLIVSGVRNTVFDWAQQSAGTYSLLIKAIDTSGNLSSSATATSIIISPPGQVQNLKTDTVDNNIMLWWTAPAAGTYDIDHYKLYKGDDPNTATLLGKISGTFATRFENASGLYTYWIVPVDTAGNEGTIRSAQIFVNQPPDFILRDDQIIAPTEVDTLTNIFVDGDIFYAPINTTETFAEKFSSRSWDSIQDQVDAGYPLWIQPTVVGVAIWEKIIDYGVVFGSSTISLSASIIAFNGDPGITAYIGYSVDGTNWTEEIADQLYAPSLRYSRVRIEIEGSDGLSYLAWEDVRIRVSTKKATDSGNGTAGLTSEEITNGTFVPFNISYLDVDSIQVTPKGSSLIIGIYDFQDVPNPTGFYVRLYNSSGQRVAGDFSWSAFGSLKAN